MILDSKLNQWSDFVVNHPFGNIFQSPEFYLINQNIKYHESTVVFLEKENKLCGLLVAIILTEHSGFLGKFSARSIIIGGPLVIDNNPLYFKEILQKYLIAIKGNVIYTQIRNLWDYSQQKEIFEDFGFKYEPHLNIQIDVSDKNKFEAKISKNKKRNFTKSQNKGLLFKELTTKTEISDSIKLIHQTYKKIGLPCPSSDFFISSFNKLYPINRIKVFGAILNDIIIGSRIELLYKDMIYDWYAGASIKESNKYPNDFLIYNILLWGHKQGFKIFDFGGAGKPNEEYGVRMHKLQFSDNLIEFGRFEYVHNRFLYELGKIGLKFYKTINDIRK